MIKRICDRCKSDKKITTYIVPVPKKIYAYGGDGNKPLIYWGQKCERGEIDLCTSCAEQLMNLITFFKSEPREEEIKT